MIALSKRQVYSIGWDSIQKGMYACSQKIPTYRPAFAAVAGAVFLSIYVCMYVCCS